MKLFKSYGEYLSTIITIIRDFDERCLNKIRLAINVCDSMWDDREKIHRLNTTIMECLWEIPEAVETGFPQYIKKKYAETRDILDYHDANCGITFEQKDCQICKDRIRIINKVCGDYQTKRPEIYAK